MIGLGDHSARFDRLAADCADQIAGIAFFFAGGLLSVLKHCLVIGLGGHSACFDRFAAVFTDQIAGIAFFFAGGLPGVLKFRMRMGAGSFAIDRHRISADSRAVLRDGQDPHHMIQSRKHGDACVDVCSGCNSRSVRLIAQRIRVEAAHRGPVHRNAGQICGIVVFQRTGKGHHFRLNQRHAMAAAGAALLGEDDADRHRVDRLFKGVGILGAQRICLHLFAGAADGGVIRAVEGILELDVFRIGGAVVIIIVKVRAFQKLRRGPCKGQRGRCALGTVVPV